MYRAKKSRSGFIISCCNGPELFEFGKEVFDQSSLLIQVFIVLTRFFAISLRRNNGLNPGFFEFLPHAFIGIITLIGYDRFNAIELIRQQHISALQIMILTRREVKTRRIAQRIAGGVDFRA